MKLIVGLGNPGEKYERNRHNVGFMFVDAFREYLHTSYQSNILQETKFDSIFSKIVVEDETFLLSKPQTFMNRSGVAVSQLLNFYKVKLEGLYVVHDDLDIPLGKYKIHLANGPKQHNGISSIEQQLGTNQFWRIRIGVDNRPSDDRMPGEAYVLQNFSNEERNIVENLFKEISSKVVSL